MEKSLSKNKLLNYMALLLLVLILAISLTACGSSSDGVPNNNQQDNSGDGSDGSSDGGDGSSDGSVSSYEISGMGYTNSGTTFQITTNLSITPLGLYGKFMLYDANSRVDFQSTSINSISVSDGTATITGDISIKEQGGSLTPGYSYEITFTDGNPDVLRIKVFKPNGDLFIELSSDVDAITSNLTITEI